VNILPGFVQRRLNDRPNLQKIIDNIGWLFIERGVRLGIGLFVGVWLARYLGPEQFGLFSYATAFVALYGALASLGLNGIVVRELVKKPEYSNDILGSAFVLRLLSGLAALGLAIASVIYLRAEDTLSRSLVAILGLSLVVKSSDIIRYWFESRVHSRYVVWVETGVFLSISAVKVIMIIQEAPLIVFVWLVLAEAVLVSIGLSVMYLKRTGTLTSWSPSLIRAKTLFKDAWPLAMSGIAIMIYMRIDQIMLGEMLGNEAVGIYSAAVKISELWYMVPVIIASSLFPSIVETRLKDKHLYGERLQSLMNFLVLLALVIAILITLGADRITLILYGDNYSGAANILAIHVWACVFVFLGTAGGKWYLAENLQRIQLYRTISGAIINICLNIILIPMYGGVGAAIATVTSYTFAAYIMDASSKSTRHLFWLKTRAIFPGPFIILFKR